MGSTLSYVLLKNFTPLDSIQCLGRRLNVCWIEHELFKKLNKFN